MPHGAKKVKQLRTRERLGYIHELGFGARPREHLEISRGMPPAGKKQRLDAAALWQAWLRGQVRQPFGPAGTPGRRHLTCHVVRQPPAVMAGIMKRRQAYAAALGAGKTPLLITAEAPDFAVAANGPRLPAPSPYPGPAAV